MKKKNRFKSIFSILITIVLFLVIALTITANVVFSDDKVPKVAGYYLYMHETNDMEPDIPQNALVFAKDAPSASLAPGNKVLCYLSDGNLALRVIYQITVNADGTSSYYPGTALEQGAELTIPRSNIFAICNYQSKALYSYIRFVTSTAGIMSLLVVPCIILIVMFLAKIARNSKDDVDDEDFMFEEIEAMTRKPASADPLFDPGHTPAAGENLERKMSSISENFEKKPVNENSPYQKAVQERTMKFRIQQQDIEDAKRQQEAAKSKVGTQIFSTQSVEEIARKQASAEPVQEAPPAEEEVIAEVKTEAKAEAQLEADPPVAAATVPASAAPKKTPMPNIDDIVKPSELRAAKTGTKINPEIAASDSIDDLLRVLESEKKKL